MSQTKNIDLTGMDFVDMDYRDMTPNLRITMILHLMIGLIFGTIIGIAIGMFLL